MTVADPGTLRAPNRTVAAALTVVPGLGQLYNGQPGKALSFFLATLFTIGPAVALITIGERVGHSLLAGHAAAVFVVVALLSVLVFLLLFVLGLFAWISALVDAWSSASALGAGDREQATRRRLFRL
jgi:hypothetical protein